MVAATKWSRLIKQCKTIKQLHPLHAHAIITGHLSPHFLSHLLNAFTSLLPITAVTSATTTLSNYALCIFNSIPLHTNNPHQLDLPTFSYNNMIRAHTLLTSPFSALLLFASMRRLSIPPDFHTFTFTLKASYNLPSISHYLIKTLHSQAFKFGFLTDLFIHNSLIYAYSIAGLLHDAHHLFDKMPFRDVVSYNALLHGFVKSGDMARARALFDEMPVWDVVSFGTIIAGYSQSPNQRSEAIQLFNHMLSLNLRPDNVALVSALSACSHLGELEQGKTIHEHINRDRIRLDQFLLTGLVDLYAKCGCIEIARKIFDLNSCKNLFTWNAMIVGLALHGHSDLILDYFFKMVEARIQPDGVTFLGVLMGCSHGGLVDEAQKIFDEMGSVYGVARELKHYGCMADLLGRAGHIREAEEMIKTMPMGGDVFVWGSLLSGCKIHGDVKMAQKAAKEVVKLKPEDGGVHSIMANVYANVGRWEDVVSVRKWMSDNTWLLDRNPGSSFLTD